MDDRVAVPNWVQAYIGSYRRAAGVLVGIRRESERSKACLKVLVTAAKLLTARAPSAIGSPSAEHARRLAEMAGMAWAAGAVIEHGSPRLDVTPNSAFLDHWARRSARWGGQLAPGLMAASDGEMHTLLYEGSVSELQAGVEAGKRADARWLVQPAYKINHGAAYLAELNAAARARPNAVHQERAEAIDQEIVKRYPDQSARISAHAFAVHSLTGIYGAGVTPRETMLRFIATYPPQPRATLQASKVAALLSDAQRTRARMALLDYIILLLGPDQGNMSARMDLARDAALVLVLLDEDAAAPDEPRNITIAASKSSLTPSSTSAAPRSEPQRGGVVPETTPEVETQSVDVIAEIAHEAERAGVAATAERQERYQRAIDADSVPDALAVIRDAAVGNDYEQAWLLLKDLGQRHPDPYPNHLVTVAPDVLGPVSLDSDGTFDGPGAGCFTVLSPDPAKATAAVARIAARLLNVDDRGTEHSDSEIARTAGAYTPNYLHDLLWCDRGTLVMLDTKGTMPAPMARAMLDIITRALLDERVPALITGWIAALSSEMKPWEPRA